MLLRSMERSDKVVEHILKQLEDNGTVVARTVRERVDLGKGSFFVILPEELEPEQIEDWAWWRVEVEDVLDPDDFLGAIVEKVLVDRKCRVLRLEDFEEYPDDSYYSSPEFVTCRVSDHDVPGWELIGPGFTDTAFSKVVSRGPCVPIIYFYRSTSPKRTTLNDQDVDEIADSLLGLAVGALDQDTYLIWWRTDLLPFPVTVPQRGPNRIG